MSGRKQNEEKSKQKASAPSGLPPRPPGSAGSTHSTSSAPSFVASSKSQRNSNTPSGSATNAIGDLLLHNNLRSILLHPLGLPLAVAFHGQDPAQLKCLAQTSKYDSANHDEYDNFLREVLDNGIPKETDLTKALAESINESREIPLKAKHQLPIRVPDKSTVLADILLSSKDKSRPLMLVEVGLNGNDWLKKLDQCVHYAKLMKPKEQPLLLGIVTIDKGEQDVVKLGVFLFLWHNDTNNELHFRISLLWNSKTCNLDDASKAFGSMLRGVCDFSSWIEKVDDDRNEAQYEYFGSNCCRVGDKVLRSYDNRYRKTERSPDIYMSPACVDVVGDVAKIIFKVPADDSSGSNDSDDFWVPSRKRSLLVIMLPFRPGRHDATTPVSFLPVIDQLEKLHQAGFVHGDIRGFNTVFGENNDQGYLIDFDFGGKAGTVYPNGYRQYLGDGKRIGEKGPILPWHDWFALGRLIFEIHTFVEPQGSGQSPWWLLWWLQRRRMVLNSELDSQLSKLGRAWKSIDHDPPPEMILELKGFLKKSQEAGWTVQPDKTYALELGKILDPRIPPEATKPRATGSPPVKKGSVK